MKRRGFVRTEIFLLVFVIFILSAFTIWSSQTILPTTFAVADCVDEDEDGYYDEDCSIEDLDCASTEGYIIDDSLQQSVESDGEYLVYKDDSNGDWDIYLYDLSSGETTLISDSSFTDIHPSIGGNFVVWQSLVSGIWQVYSYDLSTGSSQVVSSTSSHQVSPDVSSEWIVWSDFRNGDWDVYGSSAGVEYEFIVGDGDQTQARVFGNSLVYVDDSEGSNHVYLYDLNTGVSTQISSSGENVAPDTDGEYVVWQNDDSGSWDIYLYDISSGESSVVSEESDDELLPRISSAVVVWEMDSHIYSYDLVTLETDVLTEDDFEQYTPVPSSGYVYWIDEQNDNQDIYGIALGDVCSVNTGDCDDANESISPAIEEVCGDLVDNDCDGETDCEGSTESCLEQGDDSEIWTDEGWSATITSALEEEIVYVVGYGDGSCTSTSSLFYLYSVVYDESSATYVTDALVDTLTGTVENYPDDGYDVAYAYWTASGADRYYYFIHILGDEGVVGESIYICSAGTTCSAESISVSDAEDVLAALLEGSVEEDGECLSDDDCSSGYNCEDGECVSTSVDCSTAWDCSNVEWSDCSDGLSTRDVTLCTSIPEDESCYAEEYLPESEQTCATESSSTTSTVDTSSGAKSSVESSLAPEEEVPFFSWVQLLFVFGLLIGYYAWRK